MKSITCTQCGFVSWAAPEGRCKSCGQLLAAAQPAYQQAPGSREPQGSQGHWQPPQDAQGSWEQQGAQDSWQPHGAQEQWGPQDQQGHWDNQGSAYYSYGSPPKPSKGMATASLVLGVIGFFTFGVVLVGAVLGLILGVVALNRANSQPAVYGGRGVAIGGIVTNALAALSVFPLAIIMAIAIPNLLASRRAANEASAIRGLREVIAAQSTYSSTVGGGNFGTLAELRQSGLLEKNLAGGFRNGYRFTVLAFDGGCEARAVPMTYGQTGVRSFYLSYDGSDVRGEDKNGGPAEETDPLIGARSLRRPDDLYDPSPRTAPPNPMLIPQR